jgi:hypothetical protein
MGTASMRSAAFRPKRDLGGRIAGDQDLLALPYAETVVDDGVYRLHELAQGGDP